MPQVGVLYSVCVAHYFTVLIFLYLVCDLNSLVNSCITPIIILQYFCRAKYIITRSTVLPSNNGLGLLSCHAVLSYRLSDTLEQCLYFTYILSNVC